MGLSSRSVCAILRSLMPTSLQRLAVAPVAGPEPVVVCQGDADDHLRIVVELAEALRDVADPEPLSACLDPSRAWRSVGGEVGRLDAFRELLASVRLPDRAVTACIVDPDALDVAPEGTALWDDATARRERAELLDTLIRAAQRGGWIFVRPWPRLSLSLRLDFTDLVGDEPADRVGLPPGAVILRRWLAEHGGASDARLEALLAEVDGLAEALTDAALDALPPAALRAGVTLSAVRSELALNGTCGPLRWDEAGPDAVARDGVACLREAGLLLPTGPTKRQRISRILRQRLDARMTAGERGARRQAHAALARRAAGSSSPEILERHYHAVQAADLEVALETAVFFGSDLREIARERSFQGRYAEAAAIYRTIVERFDAHDAYAWEYLGYNLARAQESPQVDALDRIEAAYLTAHRLARTNPLFHGRLIGLRIEHRGAPLADADRLCALYRAQAGPLGRDWFGWQIVRALRRSGRRDDADAFQSAWEIRAPQERPRGGPIFGSGRGQMTMASDFDAPLDDFDASI